MFFLVLPMTTLSFLGNFRNLSFKKKKTTNVFFILLRQKHSLKYAFYSTPYICLCTTLIAWCSVSDCVKCHLVLAYFFPSSTAIFVQRLCSLTTLACQFLFLAILCSLCLCVCITMLMQKNFTLAWIHSNWQTVCIAFRFSSFYR